MNDDEKIKLRAHEIWESEGRPHGRDREHWDRAAREVAEERTIRSQEAASMAADAGIHGAEPPIEQMYKDRRDSPGATGETIPAPRATPKRGPRG